MFFRHRFLHRFLIDFLIGNVSKMSPKLNPATPPFGIKSRPWRPSRLLEAVCVPFGTQWSPFGYSFVSFWLPLVLFWFPFAPFWHPLSPWLHFGLLSFPFPSSGRVGALLRNFRSIWHFLHPPQEKDVENRICSGPGSKRHPFCKPILRRTTNLSVDTPLLKHVPHDHRLKARIRPWGWLDWKYHVAFHDRRTRILWNTDRCCFFMIRCLILRLTWQVTDICLCACSTPQFIIFSMATM